MLSALCGEQVIYPLGTADAIAKEGLGSEVTEASRLALEQRLDKLMEAVRLSYLVIREGGWGAQTEWGETLSLGMCLPRNNGVWHRPIQPCCSGLLVRALSIWSWKTSGCLRNCITMLKTPHVQGREAACSL